MTIVVRRGSWPRRELAGVLLLASGCAAADAPQQAVEHAPSPVITRLQAEAVPAPEAGLAVDFELIGSDLYLLEPPARVLVLRRTGESWAYAREFGRRGEGPGELFRPTGIGGADNGVVVVEPKRLQYFTSEGELQATKLVILPCEMRKPYVTSAAGGTFVHGICHRSGYTTDTLKAVLTWSGDTTRFRVVVEDVQLTRDGRVGSAFGARFALTAGTSGVHAFGAGTTNCVWRVRDGAGLPLAERQCPAVEVLYRSEPPPGVPRRLRARQALGDNLVWPATLPPFVDRFMVGDDLVLIRPISADSVVLQLAGGGPDLAVAPLNGFVGCKAGGCLWVFGDTREPRVLMLDTERLTELVRQGKAE